MISPYPLASGRQSAMLVAGILSTSLALAGATHAAESTATSSTTAETVRLALELNDRQDLTPGSFQCVNNGDPLCDNSGLYTSPWNFVPDGNHFAPDGFRGEFYDGIDAGTGPSANQQGALQNAMTDYNDYLEAGGSAACINNPSVYCD
jgi:hypothetical protein